MRNLGLVLAMAGTLGAGYLPVLGPAPLRFQALRPKPAELPPLDMGQTEGLAGSNLVSGLPPSMAVKLATATNPPAGNLPGAPRPSESPDAFEDPAETMIAVSPPPLADPAAANALITPQMLVHFFKPEGPSTNGGGVSVLVPVDLAPPPQGNSTNP